MAWCLLEFVCAIGLTIVFSERLFIPSVKAQDGSETDSPTYLTKQDFENIDKYKSHPMEKDSGEDPTLGHFRYGDISTKNLEHLIRNTNNPSFKSALKNRLYRWKDGNVPYALSSKYGNLARAKIAEAIQEYHTKTCIRFIPFDEKIHEDYIYVQDKKDCFSEIGRIGGMQVLSLGSRCLNKATIEHEFMHALGFIHEQCNPQRDNYVRINWYNIRPDRRSQFAKLSYKAVDDLGVPYDYSSIMHYGPFAFGKGKKSIEAFHPEDAMYMGQRQGFSPSDLKRINLLYNCSDEQIKNKPKIIPDSTPIPPPAKDENISGCFDQTWRCRFWAIPLFDYCTRFPEVKHIVCPRSCASCSQRWKTLELPAVGSAIHYCEDKKMACMKWRREGLCQKKHYEWFMKSRCPASCSLCPPLSVPMQRCNESSDDARFQIRCQIAKLYESCNPTELTKRFCRMSCPAKQKPEVNCKRY